MCYYNMLGGACAVNVTTFHDDLDALLTAPYVLPSYHSSIPAMFTGKIPAWHKDLGTIVSQRQVLPANHPSVENMACRYDWFSSHPYKKVVNVSLIHGDIDVLLNSSYNLPRSHPEIGPLFASVLPWWHRNLSEIVRGSGRRLLGIPYPQGMHFQSTATSVD
jgi:hypothetical protein